MANRMIAPIDEKNVCTDWIENIFDDYNLTQTQKGNTRKICGYINGELVECIYQFGENVLMWYIYSMYAKDYNVGEVWKTLIDARTELIKRLENYENEGNDLFSEIENFGTYLIQRFYFKGE